MSVIWEFGEDAFMQKEQHVAMGRKFSDSSECRDCVTEKRGGGPAASPE